MTLINVLAQARLLTGAGVSARPSDTLEVSLDCAQCERRNRTVEISRDGGECRKLGHPVNARLNDVRTEPCEADEYFDLSAEASCVSILYGFQYEFVPFKDRETGLLARQEPESGRIRVWLGCPDCGAETRAPIQPNLRRPHRIKCKSCDRLLAIDPYEQPLFRLAD